MNHSVSSAKPLSSRETSPQITGSEYIDQFEDVQYEPLPLPTSIQLLRLLPGIDQKPIHCKLLVAGEKALMTRKLC